MKTKFELASNVRQLTAEVTNADANAVELFELPANVHIIAFSLNVSDAFNTSATLAIGVSGTPAAYVAAAAIDATGQALVTLKSTTVTTAVTKVTATVSDKTATGKVAVTVLFSLLTDTQY